MDPTCLLSTHSCSMSPALPAPIRACRPLAAGAPATHHMPTLALLHSPVGKHFLSFDVASCTPPPLCRPSKARPARQKRARASVEAMAADRADGNDEEAEQEQLEVDLRRWREFRAQLIQSSAPTSTTEEAKRTFSVEVENEEGKPRGLSATSPSSWAHAIAHPEPGCLVVARPGVFGSQQQYFDRSVIFLFAHSDEIGSAGLILNRPTQYRLGQVAGFDEYMPEFRESRLHMGGDVGADSVQVLHPFRDVEGAVELCPGIFAGGYSAIAAHVRGGHSSAADFRWFVRYAGWGPGQLEREVKGGAWWLACSSPDLILRHSPAPQGSAMAAGLPVSDPPSSRELRCLWRSVLELMGGVYAEGLGGR